MWSWTLPCGSSLAPSVLHLSHSFQCFPTLNRQPYEGRKAATHKMVDKSVKHDRHNWKSAQVVSSHLVCDPTIRQSATVVSAEPLLHGTGTLWCLQKEMATYRHWSVSLLRDPDDVPRCRILSPDKTEWRLIFATLCRWRRCFVADQLMVYDTYTRIIRRRRRTISSKLCTMHQDF